MGTSERLLIAVLRVTAVVAGLALLAVFMPMGWMERVHGWLGLGAIPRGPVFEYLARSESCLYALFAGICWVVAGDVHRYAPLVRFLGLTHIVFGALLLGIDLEAGLPWYWTAAEGPVVAGWGMVVLGLSRGIR